MLSEANISATANNDALVAAENDRVQEAKKLAAAKIEEIQSQMRSCIQALDRIKQANEPAAPAAEPKQTADEMADEISQNLEAIVGTTVDHAPKAEPRHPLNDTTTNKFANLQFGRNYAPGNR
jgi:polyribonucleotide nucleotidyltransferase